MLTENATLKERLEHTSQDDGANEDLAKELALAREQAAAYKKVMESVAGNCGGFSDASALQLEQARAETRQYKEGLERAVAKLNERGQSAPPKPRRTTSRGSSSVIVRSPRAIVSGSNDVLVEGSLHNVGNAVAVGYLELFLEVDGRSGGSTTLTLEIPPRTVEEYDYTFTNAVSQGQVPSATAKWGDHNP